MSPAVNVTLEEVPFAILEAVKARILENRRKLNGGRIVPPTRPRPQFRAIGANSKGWRYPRYATNVYSDERQIAEKSVLSLSSGWSVNHLDGSSGSFTKTDALTNTVIKLIVVEIDYPSQTFYDANHNIVQWEPSDYWYKYTQPNEYVNTNFPKFNPPKIDDLINLFGETAAYAFFEISYQSWKLEYAAWVNSLPSGSKLKKQTGFNLGFNEVQQPIGSGLYDTVGNAKVAVDVGAGSNILRIKDWQVKANNLSSYHLQDQPSAFLVFRVQSVVYVIKSVEQTNNNEYTFEFNKEGQQDGLLSYVPINTVLNIEQYIYHTRSYFYPTYYANAGAYGIFPGAEF